MWLLVLYVAPSVAPSATETASWSGSVVPAAAETASKHVAGASCMWLVLWLQQKQKLRPAGAFSGDCCCRYSVWERSRGVMWLPLKQKHCPAKRQERSVAPVAAEKVPKGVAGALQFNELCGPCSSRTASGSVARTCCGSCSCRGSFWRSVAPTTAKTAFRSAAGARAVTEVKLI